MNQKSYGPHTSKELEKRLKQLVAKQDQVEAAYRDSQQRYWVICFIDITDSASDLFRLGENIVNAVLANYQTMVHQLLHEYTVCFVEPSGGPQIVCCFENVIDAVDAMGAVINLLNEWNFEQEEILRYMPAIGVHIGYVNYYDGVVHQSNTSNMAKRIQSQAKPGEIFISADIYDLLKTNYRFTIEYRGVAELKNIPEPQDIYQVTSITHKSRKTDSTKQSSTQVVSSVAPPAPLERLRERYQWVFVYIDVCGSTKKFWSYGDREASELIHRYQKLCHAVFEMYGPRYVKSCEGDQIVACFEQDKASDALVAATQIMKLLFRRNMNTSQHKQVHAAIGIHLGEVILEDGYLVTTVDMRVGKEIQSEATADEILISKEVLRLCAGQHQHALEDCGLYDFEGLPQQYHLKRLLWHKVVTKSLMIKF